MTMLVNIIFLIFLIMTIITYLYFTHNSQIYQYDNNIIKSKFLFDNDISKIDNILNNNIDYNSISSSFNNICKYGLKGGKRVRAIIIYSIYKLKNKSNDIENIKDAIIFIEYLHASSLIFDDIMDKDIYRRNNKCLYKKYNISIAQIVALYLLSIGLKHLYMFNIDYKNNEIINNIVIKNLDKLCIGQYIDITNDNNYNINDLIEFKTCSLFQLSFLLGYLSDENIKNKIKKENIEEILEIGDLFGKMFQISDDFDDYDKDLRRNPECNYLIIHGKDKSIKDYKDIYNNFINKSIELNIFTPEIDEICKFLAKQIK